MTEIDWNAELVDQLDWFWQRHLRPRFDGLTDEEYLWEPVPDCWSIRRRGTSSAPLQVGAGEFVMEGELPPPTPAPVTTIAWRLSHLIVGVLAERVGSHFGGPPASDETWIYAGTADEALAQLDRQYAAWIAGVRRLGDEGLARPCGPAEGLFADAPLATLVLHINREMLHHSAEVALLRDLYLHRAA